MPVMTASQPSMSRLAQLLIIAASLALVLTMLGFGLLAYALQQRAVEPPAFSVRIGHVQFGGPCPSPAFQCDSHLNYYAIWRGTDQPDGSIHFEELFFTYLPKKH